MKLAKIALIAATALTISNSAYAWGDREQGVLVGIGATLLSQHIMNSHGNSHSHTRSYNPPPAQLIYSSPPVYVDRYYYDVPEYRTVEKWDAYCNCIRVYTVRVR